MTQYSSGLVTIDYVAASFRNDTGIDNRHKERIKQWVIDAYTEINMAGFPTAFKSAWLTMSDVRTIDFPSDYIDYVSVSIPLNGRLWTLTKDPSIIPTRSEECGVDSMDSDRGEGETRGEPVISFYGMPGGINDTYFNDNKERRRFEFRGVDQSEVLIIYKTTGISLDSETRIPRQYVNALKAYCDWRWSKFTSEAFSVQQTNEARYWDSRKRLRRGEFKITLDEIKDVFYASMSQTIKR